jgi:ArsR family transcriptional regulator
MPLKNLPETPEAATRFRAAVDDRLDLELFKALADRTRLRTLSCLIKCGRPCSVTEVAESCEVDFSVVNKHLKILAAAGVLRAEKQGRTVWYAARCGELCDRLASLVDAIAEWCPNLQLPADRPPGTSCCRTSGRG